MTGAARPQPADSGEVSGAVAVPGPEGALNRLVLSGRITSLAPLRYTPAGVPIAEGLLSHLSEQAETDGRRRVELEMDFLAAGAPARRLAAAPLGLALRAGGFLAHRTRTRRSIVFHIVEFDWIGEHNGN